MSRSLLLLAAAAPALFAAPPAANLALAKTALAQLPLRFEANRGQFDPAVRFAARAGAYDLLFTPEGATLRSPASQPLEITLPGSNPQPGIDGLDPLRARTDYLVGARARWHTDVGNFGRLAYRQVYPGIDLIYYGANNRLEYDFVLAPGADPSAIRIRFTGAGQLRVTPEGNLVYESPEGLLLERRPVTYQENGGVRREIPARYEMVAPDTAALRIGAYDGTRQLTIDPILSYGTYLGGTQDDQITGVQLSNTGLLYICGSTQTQDIPAINGAYDNNSAGLTDIFLAIIDPSQHGNGQLVYFSYLGGSNNDIPQGIAVDQNGIAYMTGTTTSTDFPIVGNSVQTVGPVTVVQAFVAAIDPSQYGGVALIYSTFLGGQTGNNSGNAIALDSADNIYVVGTTASTDFPVTDSAYAGVLYGPSDAFLTELTIYSSTITYSTYIGGELDDDGRGVAILPNGQVYVAASTISTQFPLAGQPYRSTNSGGYDVAVMLFDVTKSGTPSLVYSTYLGGGGTDMVRGVALEPDNSLVLTGYTLSRDFPVTSDAAQFTYAGAGDAFVTVVNALTPASFLKYSTFLGGSDSDVSYAVGTDAVGNIYLTGYTLSSDFPVTSNAPQPQWGNGIDIFVAELKPHVAGPTALQYASYIGGATVNTGLAVAVGPDGTLYAAGKTEGELPTSGNAPQGGYGGGSYDGFVVTISPTSPSSTTSGLHRPNGIGPRPAHGPRPRK